MEVHHINIAPSAPPEVCRACMSKENDLKPLFLDYKDSLPTLPDILLQVTGLNVMENDGLPNHICTTCISLAQSALHFKEMCYHSDMNFRKGFSGEPVILKPYIKKECESFLSSEVNLMNFEKNDKENVEHIFEVPDDKYVDSTKNSAATVAPYQCGLCCNSFQLCSKLKEHVKAFHGNHFNINKLGDNSKYSCSICSKGFRSKKGHSSHYKRCQNRNEKNVKVKKEAASDSDSDTPLSEKIQSHATLDSLPGLDLEIESHRQDDYYDADDTEVPFDFGEVKIEINEEEKYTEEKKYSCEECNLTLTKTMYDAHVKTVHPEKKKVSRKRKIITFNGDIQDAGSLENNKVDSIPPVPLLKCTQCERKFLKESSLNAHLKKHEKELNEVHKCGTCSREFKRRAHLENHMLTHSIDKGFKCSLCPKSFTVQESLNIHIANHKGAKKHQCPHCEKGFNMLSTLKDHIRTHTGEKPFLCSICGRGFSQSTNLKEHMRRHQGYKPFKCDFCSQTFVSKGELEAHLRKHSGAHPFVCDECGGGFTTSSSLVKHKRIHSGERPYKCDFCPMRFTALGTMKNHRRTHTGEKPYKCQYCEKAFVQKNDLVTHTRTHTGERPYVCTVCGHAFRQSSALKTHLKIHGGHTDLVAVAVAAPLQDRSAIEESSSSINTMTPKSENSNL